MRKMQLLVQTRDGRKNIYEVDRFGTVGHLKARIGRAMCVPMGFSRLTYKGRVLSNQSVLEDVGVKRMSTLDLCWQPVVLTPKQLSEKEGDLDKLEQKQNVVQSGMIESYGGMVKASSSFQDVEPPAGDIPKPANSSNSLIHVEEEEEDDLEDPGLVTPSSDGLEFLATNRSPLKCDDLDEKKMAVDLVPLISLTPDPLVPPKIPETSGPSKSSNPKKKGKKNRKK
ncbi:uncharacterized protein [Drosophila takahashii]|uniref:uncharacterized protein n=1 Tax=Drosophila takahashii TaxID=29030 RepID=UPI001CF909F1|nr:uncharacterized protein LOC108070305 [Drosophila takahashii]